MGAGGLHGRGQPCLVGPGGLGRRGNPTQVLGVFGPHGLWVEGIGELFEALGRPLDLVIGVSHRDHLPISRNR